MQQVSQFLDVLVGPTCSQSLLKFEYTNIPCLKLLLSKALGLGIIFGSVLLKVPQILNILSLKSTKGISMGSYLIETWAFLIVLAYNLRRNNPFSTYGEGFFITCQNIIILLMMLYYQKASLSSFMLLLASFALSGILFSPLFPAPVLSYLQLSTLFLALGSKCPQIYVNFKNKSTGALSFITLALQFLGTLARIFTTIQEVKDPMILGSFILAGVLNGSLVLQWIIYRRTSKDEKIKKTKAGKLAKKKNQ
jgi:uncharacterized protein with PQ loop repeat